MASGIADGRRHGTGQALDAGARSGIGRVYSVPGFAAGAAVGHCRWRWRWRWQMGRAVARGRSRRMMPRATRTGMAADARDSGWIVLLSDLMALLLAFFVLMYAMAAVPAVSWQALRAGLGASAPPSPAVPAARQRQAGNALGYVAALIAARADASPLLAAAQMQFDADELSLALPDAWLWAADGSLSAAARAGLATIAEILQPHDNRLTVMVQGRDWRVSLAVADALADALRAGGYERPIARAAQQRSQAAVLLQIAMERQAQ
ncbi:MAG: hypothetical protein D6782_11655 [Alphaproteobacteria bacterium]|nr:MAG: hypothetical protein D6782_11655 [Alphaproteobacteria bacterium]